MKYPHDLTGLRFGRLYVVKRIEKPDEAGHYRFICKCDCGSTKIVSRSDLTSMKTQSCGCLRNECAIQRRFKHGKSNDRIYMIWRGMKRRCYNPNEKCYRYYGGKNIKVCAEWKDDFMSFYQWAIDNGYRDDLTIDRIDVNGDYAPNNCRWITLQEQHNNRSDNRYVTIGGVTKHISEWYAVSPVTTATIYARIKNGMDIEKAIMMPDRRKERHRNR